jgi:GntR family transcriptional regulator of vanillate catabolism
MSRDTSIADQIRNLIFSGEIKPGEQLLENPTAERLGISRTPLRPALAALAQEGLLQPRGRRGYVVRKVSIEDVMDAFIVRANLEGLAASLVAQRGLEPASRSRIEAILTHGDALLSARTNPSFEQDFRAMNDDFHNAILEASRNECLQDLARRALMLPLLSSRVVHFDDQAALLRSHLDHWTLLDALDGQEAERARAIMSEHILRSRDILRKRMMAAKTNSS